MVGIIMVGTIGIVLIATIMVMPTIRGIGVITMRGIVRGTITIRMLVITTIITTIIRCITNRTTAVGRTPTLATTIRTLRTKLIVCNTTAPDVMAARAQP